jgi:1-phosphofructokinase
MKPDAKIATITLNPAIDQTVVIPNFAAGSVNRVQDFRCDAGGKGVNVAAFLADYGLPVTATGFLGKENPHLFERFFKQKMITDRFVRIVGSTRTGIKIIDEAKQETTDINFPGQTPTPADLQLLLKIIDELSAECRWFVVAGSIPAGTSTDIYREIITAIAQKGGQVALDASGEGFREAVTALPALVKPNVDELQEFCGHSLNNQAEVIGAARRLIDQGLQTVVVSMGEKGALFVDKAEVIRAIPPKVRVESTVGAGDAMLSGMVVGKIENRSLNECARLATAFSVMAVTRIGAGLPSETSLDSIECQVQLVEIKR